MDNLWIYFGLIVLIAGIGDSYKYRLLSNKIKRLSSSRGVSRQFINIAIFHKVILSIWAIFYLKDWVVAISSLLALYTSLELWYYCYINYHFFGKGRFGWKRPNIFKYIWNSLLPNKITPKI